MTKKPDLKFADFLIIIIFIAVIVFFIFFASNNTKNSKQQVIIENGKNTWIYPLDKNAKYEVYGKIGKSVIVVKDKKVYFEESPCNNKLCISSRPIAENGKWIACLPNKVIIRIESAKIKSDYHQEGTDAVSK
ncbi:MAG: NusG domain II-containing protein [Treponemataceae bacterium]